MYPKLRSPFQGPKCYPIPVDAEMLPSVWDQALDPKMGTKVFRRLCQPSGSQQPQIMPDERKASGKYLSKVLRRACFESGEKHIHKYAVHSSLAFPVAGEIKHPARALDCVVNP